MMHSTHVSHVISRLLGEISAYIIDVVCLPESLRDRGADTLDRPLRPVEIEGVVSSWTAGAIEPH